MRRVTSETDLARRGFLSGTAATVLALAAVPALARAPMIARQAPGFYRFKIGAFECNVVSDGPLPLGDPSGAFLGMGKEQMSKVLTDNFLPGDSVTVEQNAILLNTGDRLVLFDTGMGTSTMFGSGAGRLLENMRLAGYDPKDVDAVVVSHAHIDHCNGIMGAGGARNFPNAQIYLHRADLEFWTDEAKLGTPLKDLIVSARENLLPNRDRMVFFNDGQEFLPGIQAIHAPGHTVGHTAFMIGSQGKSFCYIADAAHHSVLAMENPRIEFAFDTDKAQAVTTRLRVFDMLASTRTPFLAYHFPWPGIGHLAKTGNNYRYVPSPMQTVL